ncbi:hypothetical protein ACS8Y6_15440 [Salinisphaera sp. RV14]|uniref:hypothetical protein n=1 Tax=Salinisphaera sp. RV14 TaxID=3454140 RepID=UPI003F869A11
MKDWTIQTLRDLDLKYAEEGIHPHQRPFHAASEILGDRFAIGVGANAEVERVTAAFEAMLSESNENWPGMGTGIAAVVDQVRRITAPVVFGAVSIQVWRGLGFNSEWEWWIWCRENRQVASRTCFAFADLFDLTYGLDDLQRGRGRGLQLWRMATSNVSDFANILPGTFSVDSVVQPICLAVELSLKAAIVQAGEDPDSFRKRGAEGHDLERLAKRVARELPHRDDPQIAEIAAAMPKYIESRYAPAGFKRSQVVRLALGAQFIAASSVRRHSRHDLAAEMEQGNWPGSRLSLLS